MPFNQNPILNSPYEAPAKHWQLDDKGMPTGVVTRGRRPSSTLMPIPDATAETRREEGLLELHADPVQQEDNSNVNILRDELEKWRKKPFHQRGISGDTIRLLQHWTENKVIPRPFFCQIEAVETLIWLNEVAPQIKTKKMEKLWEEINRANEVTSMGLPRRAAKMATGAGKTTVMAMLIAYHAINKSRNPKQQKYSNRFLIITPGITIKDRLRVLLPQDPHNYYEHNNIVPRDMLGDVKNATVIITNYHAFKHREKLDITESQREMLKGNSTEELDTKETKGQMLRRVCPELLRGGGKIIVINDEAHHCYNHKQEDEETPIDAEEKEEIKRNNEAARLWINGIYALQNETKQAISNVYDLSATPFFLRGSGYREGSLFQWVVSDFSLMDAIESGIVKLPRVPTKDATAEKLPIYRNLYQHIRKDLPKKGAARQKNLDPQKLPSELMGAIKALYSHYEETYDAWQKQGITVPPVFIIVCNNTSTSKLVYDLVSGYEVTEGRWAQGECDLFNNVKEDSSGLLARPRTLLIDSYQLESGDALSDDFRKAATAEIDQFKKELRVREPSRDISKITDTELLREAMNTVGKKGRLGERIRCVVSVSMLTEGWDTNNVTHILGVRAFGTQLLCEQVVGRALRRHSYQLEEEGENVGKFLPEYADVFGVPFKFASGADVSTPVAPKPPHRVRHLDEREKLEITFPRVRGYRIKPPETRITANFDDNSRLTIKPEMAPPRTAQEGIIGEGIVLTLDKLKEHRANEVVYSLAAYIAAHYYKEKEGGIAPARFRDLVPIVRYWLEHYVRYQYGTFIQYFLWPDIAGQAAEIIYRACAPGKEEQSDLLTPMIDNFNDEGSTVYVDFLTRKKRLHETQEDKSHINIAVCDSDWEMEFCKTLEATPEVFAYARNEGLGFEVPYEHDHREHIYLPDYIILMDDGHGKDDLLRLVVEVKGYRNSYAQAKADTMNKLWIPAVNNHGGWGRWAFEEIMDPQYLDMRLIKDQTPPGKVLEKYTRRNNGKGGN